MLNFVQRRRFLLVLFLLGLAAIALTAALTGATTLARLRFEELAQTSTAIARLRCVGSEVHWDRGEIVTDTHFEVLEQNKGLLSGFITVRTIGGAVRGLHSRVDGMPVFRAGEEVYLFLWARPGEPYQVLGWSQGAFRITRDPEDGIERVTQDSARLPLFDPRTRQFRHGGIRNLPMAVFQLKLRKALEQRNLD
jgi:hypothetical protein